MYHRGAIECSPLQAYVSALLFSPVRSLTKKLFHHEEPGWIKIRPAVGDDWSACLQTLEGHSDDVYSVAFSHDSSRLASGSGDRTVKIWDASSGACLQTLEGHSSAVSSVAFSHDSSRLASGSWDDTVKIWDTSSGACLQTLEGHSDDVNSLAFSHDSSRLASGSWDNTVKIWDASSGVCLQTLEGHSSDVSSVAFSHDSSRLASGSWDRTVKIWDASSWACLDTLNVGKELHDLSFDSTSSYLYTEIGSFAISTSEDSGTLSIAKPENPLHSRAGISLDRVWITCDGEKTLWLPSEYRESCLSVRGTKIGIGVGSGKVWICSFDLEKSENLSSFS
jgi:WD40 repeat protein